ncbi:MAG: hypothetical protein ACYS9X_16850, partial [Planctomycetota bacterium]
MVELPFFDPETSRLHVTIKTSKETILFSAQKVKKTKARWEGQDVDILRMVGVTKDKLWKRPFTVECPVEYVQDAEVHPIVDEPRRGKTD